MSWNLLENDTARASDDGMLQLLDTEKINLTDGWKKINIFAFSSTASNQTQKTYVFAQNIIEILLPGQFCTINTKPGQ